MIARPCPQRTCKTLSDQAEQHLSRQCPLHPCGPRQKSMVCPLPPLLCASAWICPLPLSLPTHFSESASEMAVWNGKMGRISGGCLSPTLSSFCLSFLFSSSTTSMLFCVSDEDSDAWWLGADTPANAPPCCWLRTSDGPEGSPAGGITKPPSFLPVGRMVPTLRGGGYCKGCEPRHVRSFALLFSGKREERHPRNAF
jgi:hypothetical protein